MDNSGKVQVDANRYPGIFYWGSTIPIVYTATDEAKNSETCNFTVTVKPYPCSYQAPPINGALACDKWLTGQYCTVTCNENFTFVSPPEKIYYCRQDERNKQAIWTSLLHGHILKLWSDCSEIKSIISRSVGMELEFPTVTCDDTVEIKEKIAEVFIENLKEFQICNLADCKVQNVAVHCGANNGSREKRATNSETKVYFEIVVNEASTGLYDGSSNLKDTSKKILDSIKDDIMSKRLVLDLNNTNVTAKEDSIAVIFPVAFQCDPGQVAVGGYCVSCPVGTYNNYTMGECELCPLGTYQDTEGAVNCKICPISTMTARKGTKWQYDCRSLCKPGTYSDLGLETCIACPLGTYQDGFGATDCIPCDNQYTTWTIGAVSKTFCSLPCRQGYVSDTGFEPCNACSLGFYQNSGGRTDCLPCPDGLTTTTEGAHTVEYCQNITACELNPCANGGTCLIEDSWSVGPPCRCEEGFEGVYCEIVVNRCDYRYSICYNNGTCVNGDNYFTCICSEGFTGSVCLEDINDCESDPCLNEGQCFDRVADYHCECPKGFSGKSCELNHYDCGSDPCQNGGTCFDLANGFMCCCVPGYEGSTCEQEVDNCASNPCHNGATCHHSSTTFNCTCLAGFSGTTCDVNIDDCLERPCRNGGTCEDLTGGYLCLCTSAFSGQWCQIESNPDFDLTFVTGQTDRYVKISEGFPMLHAFTLSFWMKTSDTKHRRTPVSYAYRKDGIVVDNGLTLQNYKSFQLYINGIIWYTDISANSLFWHHILITWDSLDGSCNLFFDNVLKISEQDISKGQPIYGNGTFVIGQDQDTIGGRFSTEDSFRGTISQVNLWDKVLTSAEIGQLYEGCSSHQLGNVFAWPTAKYSLYGDIKPIEPSSLCTRITQCSPITCQHGGTCTDLVNHQTRCDCAYGYGGDQCQKVLEPCHESFCNSNGQCFMDGTAQSCNCFEGFTGLHCESAVNCRVGFCKNGGSCLHGDRCNCEAGMIGNQCQYDVNECFLGNGGCEGTCTNTFGSFSCGCTGNYILHSDGKSCVDPSYCDHMGKLHLNGESWERNCETCQCNSSYIACLPKKCPILQCNLNEYPFHSPGDCCPKCIQDGVECTVDESNRHTTFDGHSYKYNGSCLYTLAQDWRNSDFTIHIKHKDPAVEQGQQLLLYIFCDTLTIFSNGSLMVGESEIVPPWQAGRLRVSRSDDGSILVNTNVGVKVLWKQKGVVVINVPRSYKRRMRGMCGNMDGEESNDMTTKQFLPSRTTKEFMMSWRVERYKHCNERILPNLPPYFKTNIRHHKADRCIFVSLKQQLRVLQLCGTLRSSAFKPCHRIVPARKFYTRCLQDSCVCGHNESCFCDAVTAYANECLRRGVTIFTWKNKQVCDMKCSGGRVYDDCGPSCPETCHSFWIGRNNTDCWFKPCIPGCNCPASQLLHNNQCIAHHLCPEQFLNFRRS
ncbi:hypothetical protein ScPMuIL_010703 [Solemya velum]